MHLVKFLTLAVDVSRHQASFFIKKNRVCVDGVTISDPKFLVSEESCVTFDGKPVSIPSHRYFLLNKPVGYVCTGQDKRYPSVITLISDLPEDNYYYVAGALEQNVSGLVLISDDLKWINRIKLRLRKSKKYYDLMLDRQMDASDEAKIHTWCDQKNIQCLFDIRSESLAGSHLCAVCVDGDLSSLREVLGGLGYKVKSIVRTMIGKLSLDSLGESAYVEVNVDQIKL